MVVAGLWHGAALGFVFWGFLHGLFLVIDKHIKRKKNLGESKNFLVSFLGWLVTQTSVFFAWIFFRNPDLGDAAFIITAIIQRAQGTFEISDALLVVAALVVTILLDLLEIHLIPRERRINPFVKGLLLGVLLVVVFLLKSSSVIPFIYFEF
jgi:alginate O-acetyltransferase complex protein AlgI